jgi:inhibitor of KinA sporulation pathway (predicted exonuclease)
LIYDKIDAIFSDELAKDEPPQWAKELLSEMKELKQMMRKTETITKAIQSNLYDFIEEFKATLQPDIANNIYGVVRYKAQEIALNEHQRLFDVHTKKEITTLDAFNVFRYFQSHHYEIKYKKIS